MEKIAVFVNDAAHARQLLQPLLRHGAAVHWVLVACSPTLSRHIGRWVTQPAREQWLERWAAELFARIEPELRLNPGCRVEKMLVKRPLIEVSARLQARLGKLRLLDARRPRMGKPDEPLLAVQLPAPCARAWASAPVLAGSGAVTATAD